MMKLLLSNRDEMYFVPLEKVLYFEAKDHYTVIRYDNGSEFTVPFNLSYLAERVQQDERFLRVGRSHIVNQTFIHHVNAGKQILELGDNPATATTLSLSRPMLRALMNRLNQVAE
jgi:DNA-binding LytR/AlgR family response regulator